MDDSTLIAVYNSYVSRIHDFRREQYIVILILTGFFTFLAKAFIDLRTEGKLVELADGIYWIVTIVSIIMNLIYFGHSIVMLIFSQRLGIIEKKLKLSSQVCFYSVHIQERRWSYLISQMMPTALYCGVIFLMISFTGGTITMLLTYIKYTIGVAIHIAIIILHYIALRRIRKKI